MLRLTRASVFATHWQKPRKPEAGAGADAHSLGVIFDVFPSLGVRLRLFPARLPSGPGPPSDFRTELLSLPHWQWGFRAAKNLKPSHVL
jgi:hypothetical protein